MGDSVAQFGRKVALDALEKSAT